MIYRGWSQKVNPTFSLYLTIVYRVETHGEIVLLRINTHKEAEVNLLTEMDGRMVGRARC
jgi:hypothetical protein